MKKFFVKLLVLSMAATLSITACGASSDAEGEAVSQQKEFQLPEEEPNTSAMVDAIILQAKADAETATDEDLQAAFTFIKDTYPDFFTDNEVMEKVMYYGSLLEYAYRDTEETTMAELGMDAVQTVKYVYRGAETVEDEATKLNLEQVNESLTALSE